MSAAMQLASFAISDPKVDFIQIDSLVVMKIVKHVDIEFYSGMSEVAGETCQGILTGLISTEEKRDENNQSAANLAEDKQSEILDMLKRFRNMNIDYELVGFYQAHLYGACYTHDMLESLVDYQTNIHDGVVIIYDPIKTRQGQLSIRAFRLSKKALELSLKHKLVSRSYEASKSHIWLSSGRMPVVMKNSHLMNVMWPS
uniref:JAB1/MPN/MOV34 metalloenzyme domain-containing protein n=1 Tax=Ditylenchus dipsaci TaxID=166011 RepID=A0A915DMQ1_9BILA